MLRERVPEGPPLPAGPLFVLFAYFLILAWQVTNADGNPCHSLCTLAKQVNVERDPTPDIPVPIVVSIL